MPRTLPAAPPCLAPCAPRKPASSVVTSVCGDLAEATLAPVGLGPGREGRRQVAAGGQHQLALGRARHEERALRGRQQLLDQVERQRPDRARAGGREDLPHQLGQELEDLPLLLALRSHLLQLALQAQGRRVSFRPLAVARRPQLLGASGGRLRTRRTAASPPATPMPAVTAGWVSHAPARRRYSRYSSTGFSRFRGGEAERIAQPATEGEALAAQDAEHRLVPAGGPRAGRALGAGQCRRERRLERAVRAGDDDRAVAELQHRQVVRRVAQRHREEPPPQGAVDLEQPLQRLALAHAAGQVVELAAARDHEAAAHRGAREARGRLVAALHQERLVVVRCAARWWRTPLDRPVSRSRSEEVSPAKPRTFTPTRAASSWSASTSTRRGVPSGISAYGPSSPLGPLGARGSRP